MDANRQWFFRSCALPILLVLACEMMGCGATRQSAEDAENTKSEMERVIKQPGAEQQKAAIAKAVAAQEQCSQTLEVPVEITNRFGMKFRLIPSGEFLMGSPDSDSNATQGEKPQHEVLIAEPFYLGAHEVTELQFEQVMLGDPSHSANGSSSTDQGAEGDTSDCPVRMIAWERAVEFCERLSVMEGKVYRLPSESEWEYACRAGTTTPWFCGNDETELRRYAWYKENSGGAAHPVGGKEANAWGLFDMHGNVTEWCQDVYLPYSNDGTLDTGEAGDPNRRVTRGGGMTGHALSCRSASRPWRILRSISRTNGFRVVAVPSRQPEPSVKGHVTQADGWKTTVRGPRIWVEPDAAKVAVAAQKECSQRLGTPVAVTNSIGMSFALVPPGEFLMGSPESAPGAATYPEKPQHPVRLTKPLYLGVHEVTVGQFRRFVEATEYRTESESQGKGGYGWNEADGKSEGPDPKYSWRDPGFQQADDHPVVNVTWNDAGAFCAWLRREEGTDYRLPTEAEWEYACRAGTTTRYYCGEDAETVAQMGNVADGTARKRLEDGHNPQYLLSRDGYVFTAPVGCFRPNAFGLFDMHGNVYEWCRDRFGLKYYKESPVEDPNGPPSGPNRVARGGGWKSSVWWSRSAFRAGFTPDCPRLDVGFRVAYMPEDASRS
jgi:formylglycine-generating enzyme required for sulfatase activity